MNNKKNILIIEDDIRIKQKIETLLYKKGYNVQFVESTEEKTNNHENKLPSDLVLHEITFSENPNPVLRISSEGDILYYNEASQVLLEKWQYFEQKSLPTKLKQYILETLKRNIIRRFETDFADIILSLTLAPNIEKNYVNIYGFEITERKRIIEALRNSQSIYHNLFNNSEVGMFRTRIDGSEALNANEKYLQIFGWKREDVIGKPTQMHWANPDQRKVMIRKLKADGHIVDYECKLMNKKGEERDCLVSLNAYPKEEILNGSIIDITERKQAEDLLKQSHDNLSNLAAYMDVKVEEEKKKIARKIHDELGQQLTAIKMKCSILKKNNLGNNLITVELDEVKNLLDNGIQQVQEITKEIRSVILYDLGIIDALHSKIQDLEKVHGIKTNFICKPIFFHIDQDIATAIYKTFLELLTNIVRHAQTKKIEIRFQKYKSSVKLTVNDFGIGITNEQISNSFSFGLIGIVERLKIIQGKMDIIGTPGKGTSVKIRIPLSDSK